MANPLNEGQYQIGSRPNAPVDIQRPVGRPPGPTSHLTKKLSEAAKFAQRIIDDPAYLDNLLLRARSGVLPAGLEALLWYYKFGKPVHRVELSGPGGVDLSSASEEEIEERAVKLQEIALMLKNEKNRQLNTGHDIIDVTPNT